ESTGVPQLTVPQLAKYKIFFPKSLDEEEKIGSYFRDLDHLIALHQRKLEKLKNLKKAYLNELFV
ncbi:restriction endonuclease subunit S, partial [Granulicatella sp. zg-ZJ]|uniref:restriction endonuclease subunit S n=1 Tax=Granulicatella sp. zg-ZJ TaxID=2678504 RepID=UPI0013F83474